MPHNAGELSETTAVEFEAVLQSHREESIHTFLARHTPLVGLVTWGGFIRSKFRLADAFVPDFLAVGIEPLSNSPIARAVFIEIERADVALFTRTGDPSSSLTHAIRQVQDWKLWTRDNRQYLQQTLQRIAADDTEAVAHRRADAVDRFLSDGSRFLGCLSHGFTDRYLIVCGRRATMSVTDRLRLSQMNEDLQRIKIITYDVLMDALIRALAVQGGMYPYREDILGPMFFAE